MTPLTSPKLDPEPEVLSNVASVLIRTAKYLIAPNIQRFDQLLTNSRYPLEAKPLVKFHIVGISESNDEALQSQWQSVVYSASAHMKGVLAGTRPLGELSLRRKLPTD